MYKCLYCLGYELTIKLNVFCVCVFVYCDRSKVYIYMYAVVSSRQVSEKEGKCVLCYTASVFKYITIRVIVV